MSETVVCVGSKLVMNYVAASMTSFKKNSGDVVIKAGGRSISTAVDVVKGTLQGLLKDLKPRANIGTGQMDGARVEERTMRNHEAVNHMVGSKPRRQDEAA